MTVGHGDGGAVTWTAGMEFIGAIGPGIVYSSLI